MLPPEGKVTVLDFGLAKAWASDTPNGSTSPAALSQSPTLAQTGTVAGVILGTAGYMAPEQARGEPGDKRADVWSFGVLLWERLTGRALFDGETVTDVIAAVSRLSVVPCYGFRGTSLINTTPCGATMASNFPSCSPRSF